MSDSDLPLYLYRTFHEGSAGRNSRYGFKAGQENGPYDTNERRTLIQHFNLNNRSPTPWISTTDDLLRAIKIARSHEIRGKRRIRIAVIDVKSHRDNKPVSAERKSDEYGIRDAVLRRTEFLYFSQIPERAIVTCVPWQTLIDQGLDDIVPELNPEHYDVGAYEELDLAELRLKIEDSKKKWRRRKFLLVGEAAAKVAECFGIGAYTKHICISVMEDWWGVEYWPTGDTGKAIQQFEEKWDNHSMTGNRRATSR